MNSGKIFLTGLNGLRTIAALSVVVSHTNDRFMWFDLPNKQFLALAGFGVTMFFVVSGFLITFLLLKELEKTKTIDVKKFYARRILRIWPLYYGFLIVAILVAGFSTVNNYIWFYLLLLPNLLRGVKDTLLDPLRNIVSPYWSLGVEEQFYAFWPWVVRKWHKYFKYALLIPIAFVLIKVILRLVDAPYLVKTIIHYSRFGCMVIGCFGAYMYLHHEERIKKFFNSRLFEIMAWGLLILIGFNKFHIASLLDHEIFSVFVVGMIVNQISDYKPLISLENRWMDYLGKISYGIYIYHTIIIWLLAQAARHVVIENDFLKTACIYPLVIGCTILVADLSYRYFESWFLKRKFKYTVIPSTNSSTSK